MNIMDQNYEENKSWILQDGRRLPKYLDPPLIYSVASLKNDTE